MSLIWLINKMKVCYTCEFYRLREDFVRFTEKLKEFMGV